MKETKDIYEKPKVKVVAITSVRHVCEGSAIKEYVGEQFESGNDDLE